MVLRWGSVLLSVLLLAACSGGGEGVSTGASSTGVKPVGASVEDASGLVQGEIDPSFEAAKEFFEQRDELLRPENYFEVDIQNPGRMVRADDQEEIVLPTNTPIELGLRTLGFLHEETRFVLAEADNILQVGEGALELKPIKGFFGRYDIETVNGRKQLVVYLKSKSQRGPEIAVPASDEIVVGKVHSALLAMISGQSLESGFYQHRGVYSFRSSQNIGLGYRSDRYWLQLGKAQRIDGDVYIGQGGISLSSALGEFRCGMQSSVWVQKAVSDVSLSAQYMLPVSDGRVQLGAGVFVSTSAFAFPVTMVRLQFMPVSGMDVQCTFAMGSKVSDVSIAVNFSE